MHAPARAITAARTRGFLRDDVARAASTDVYDWRDALCVSELHVELLVEGEDGVVVLCGVEVAGAAAAGEVFPI